MGVTPPEAPRHETPPPAAGPPAAVQLDDERDPFSLLPFDLNGELVVYLLATILIALVAWLSDLASAGDFIVAYTALTFAYLLSRGIAKAGRVWER